MTDNTTTVEIDISDEDFLTLAKEAHERGITLNDLCVQLLEEYVNKKLSLDSNDVLEEKLIATTRDIVRVGVTEETLAAYGYAFSRWVEEYTRETTCTEIIQKGFVAADIM
jgi:hypothetical protein